MESSVSPSTIAWLAFLIGAVFGAAGNRTHFCTMGAVSDIVNMEDWSRMRMWLLAIAVAMLGTGGLQLAGVIDVSKSIYATPNITWLSNIVGGLAFGIGMTLASGCGGKTLIRIGGGNLKSLVVFVFLGLAAYMTLRGLFGGWRVKYLDPVAIKLAQPQDIASLLAAGDMPRPTAIFTALAITALPILVFVFARRDFLTFDNLLGGLAVGLTVIAGWYISGKIGYLPEDPNTLEEAFIATNSGRMESLSFVAPYAYTLELLMFWTDTSRIVTFGIAATLGVISGSAAYALASKSFRWEGFHDASDTANHIIGGILMGFGGVTAMGCTIGQGVTGLSTLAIGSFISFFAVVAGAWATLKYLYWRMMRSEL